VATSAWRKAVPGIRAFDVLEHVDDLDGLFTSLLSVTAGNGAWIISGPSENALYRMMRKLAWTRGEGHVRSIYDVFDAIPAAMRRERLQRLPFGVPLFLIGRFRRV
jgi:hypothetical protein